ncbi:hypothetical protein HN958_02990 [Candidatus Falkowbacteria bacterium]|jgi:hypothetical protein|nr:hypothetical protein [Candidatus Falkowbacteria bacterium]MBT7007445.1 hypothetical protein [Candidatus Falkowbacteria bacterium]
MFASLTTDSPVAPERSENVMDATAIDQDLDWKRIPSPDAALVEEQGYVRIMIEIGEKEEVTEGEKTFTFDQILIRVFSWDYLTAQITKQEVFIAQEASQLLQDLQGDLNNLTNLRSIESLALLMHYGVIGPTVEKIVFCGKRFNESLVRKVRALDITEITLYLPT